MLSSRINKSSMEANIPSTEKRNELNECSICNKAFKHVNQHIRDFHEKRMGDGQHFIGHAGMGIQKQQKCWCRNLLNSTLMSMPKVIGTGQHFIGHAGMGI